jgi:hypothetical protein
METQGTQKRIFNVFKIAPFAVKNISHKERKGYAKNTKMSFE